MTVVDGFEFRLPLFVLVSGGINAAIDVDGKKCGCLFTDEDLAERAAASRDRLGTEGARIIAIQTDNILITALSDWRITGVDSIAFDPPKAGGVVRGARLIPIVDLIRALAAT